MKASGGQIAAAVAATGTTLTSLFGMGPVIALRILAEAGNVGQLQPHRPDVGRWLAED